LIVISEEAIMFEISSAEEPQPRLEIKEVKPEDSAKLA
jgi:hypothetical protein